MLQEEHLFNLRKGTQAVLNLFLPLLDAAAQAVADGMVPDDDDECSPSEATAPTQEPPRDPEVLVAGFMVHPSHRMRTHGAFSNCMRCGRYSRGTRLQKLRAPCGLPTSMGRQSLARIAKGLPPPPGTRDWHAD